MKNALLLPLFLVLITAGYVEGSKEVTVKGFRFWSSESYTRVVVDLDGPVKYTRNRLTNPERLYFDLSNSRLSRKSDPSLPIGDGILRKLRAAQYKKKTVRVVLDLQDFNNYNTFILSDPYRLVIDVFAKKAARNVPEKKIPKKIEKIKKVVIDPGHGGKDPGAIGSNGLREKDVVLSVAKSLARILREKYNMEVILTRDKDIFIPLEERTAIANSNKADLFISIHANASRRKKARGIETYILNWTTNKEAMRVAARENSISFKKMEQAQSDLQIILKDLERENKKDESMRLAYNVQDKMVRTISREYKRIVDLGVKQALFYVLIGAEMPAVLVEISFISNKVEAKRLSMSKYRKRLAEAIASGVQDYAVPKKTVNPVGRQDWKLFSDGVKSTGDKI